MQFPNPRFKSIRVDFVYFTGTLSHFFLMEFSCSRTCLKINCHDYLQSGKTHHKCVLKTLQTSTAWRFVIFALIMTLLLSLCDGKKTQPHPSDAHLFLMGLTGKICLKQDNFPLMTFLNAVDRYYVLCWYFITKLLGTLMLIGI